MYIIPRLPSENDSISGFNDDKDLDQFKTVFGQALRLYNTSSRQKWSFVLFSRSQGYTGRKATQILGCPLYKVECRMPGFLLALRAFHACCARSPLFAVLMQ